MTILKWKLIVLRILTFLGEYKISSNAVKNRIYNECVARVKIMIFSIHEMKYIWYEFYRNNVNFYFVLHGKLQKAIPYLFLAVSCPNRPIQCLFGFTLGVNEVST